MLERPRVDAIAGSLIVLAAIPHPDIVRKRSRSGLVSTEEVGDALARVRTARHAFCTKLAPGVILVTIKNCVSSLVHDYVLWNTFSNGRLFWGQRETIHGGRH